MTDFTQPIVLATNYFDNNSTSNQDNSSTDKTVVNNCLDWFDYSFFTLESGNYIEGTANEDLTVSAIGWYLDGDDVLFDDGIDIKLLVETSVGSGTFTTESTNNSNNRLEVVEPSAGDVVIDSGKKFRIIITAIGNPGEEFKVRQISIGKKVQPPFGQRAGVTRPSFPGDTKFSQNSAVNGSFIGRDVIRNSKPDSFKWEYLEESFIKNHYAPFVLEANKHAFFYSWWPSKYPNETVFATATKLMRPKEMSNPEKKMAEVSYLGLSENY